MKKIDFCLFIKDKHRREPGKKKSKKSQTLRTTLENSTKRTNSNNIERKGNKAYSGRRR